MSLRDVERAMNVMVWFYNHRDALNPLMDGATDEDSDDEDDDDDDSDADDEEDEIFQVILINWNSKRNACGAVYFKPRLLVEGTC